MGEPPNQPDSTQPPVSKPDTNTRHPPGGGPAAIENLEQARAEIARLSAELVRVRSELDQFTTIVSHDLRSPLLSMTGCVELLAEQYRGQLGPEADELIGFITGGVRRLNDMIKALLDYSRANSRPLKITSCDLNQVLENVLYHFDPLIQKLSARVTRDPLPTVQADPARMEALLTHLIDNALKFRREQPPQVTVRAVREPDRWRVSVQDNGIGFDPQHAERVFRVFGRLHADDSPYPGTGIGLALARKIVERHGGTISVETSPGKGSTFHFTLPAVD